ncbi:MAG: methionine synthase [Promethearchaeota archaeon]
MTKIKIVNSKRKKEKVLVIGCIGQCVHVAGAYNFMNLATQIGYKCIFLGPATQINTIIGEIEKTNPEIVGLSYRLTPSTVNPLLNEFIKSFNKLPLKPKRVFFAGTPQVVEEAKKYDFFDQFFIGGESHYQILSILKGENQKQTDKCNIPMDLISRIKWKEPYPVLRAHFGLSNLEDTIKGIRELAKAEVIDIISIAPDQNTQANYFHPEDRVDALSGAGGVPLREELEFFKLHEARLTGNFPLLRIYAGTRDFIQLAKLYQRTINNAWAAIPIFWFNQMDGRGSLSLEESIKQHLKAIKWHAENNIPVEINDPHHWSLRDAPDAIVVADMLLCGRIAKTLGVKCFIAQYMFNTPPSSALEMDLAKNLAADELLQELVDDSFNIIRQVRTGLASFPLNLEKAKGQLAGATMIQLAIKPDIVHVVSFSEATHAARPKDIIESCNIVDQVITQSYSSKLNFIDNRVIYRKEELKKQARWIVDLIPSLIKPTDEVSNPWINHELLARLVELGIFDAPHLKNNKYARGLIKTIIEDGACNSWDDVVHRSLNEIERITQIITNYSHDFPALKRIKNQPIKTEVGL